MSENQKNRAEGLDEISLDLPSEKIEADSANGDSGMAFNNFNSAAIKLEAVEDFINIAVADCSFSEFITRILLSIMRAVESEAASILEINQEKQVLFFRASTGKASDIITGFEFPLDKGIASEVIKSRKPMIFNDIEKEGAHLKSIGDAVGFDTMNMVAIPLIIRSRVYGVLELLNRVGQPKFSDEDLVILNYLCDMASKVIELRMMIAWEK